MEPRQYCQIELKEQGILVVKSNLGVEKICQDESLGMKLRRHIGKPNQSVRGTIVMTICDNMDIICVTLEFVSNFMHEMSQD